MIKIKENLNLTFVNFFLLLTALSLILSNCDNKDGIDDDDESEEGNNDLDQDSYKKNLSAQNTADQIPSSLNTQKNTITSSNNLGGQTGKNGKQSGGQQNGKNGNQSGGQQNGNTSGTSNLADLLGNNSGEEGANTLSGLADLLGNNSGEEGANTTGGLADLLGNLFGEEGSNTTGGLADLLGGDIDLKDLNKPVDPTVKKVLSLIGFGELAKFAPAAKINNINDLISQLKNPNSTLFKLISKNINISLENPEYVNATTKLCNNSGSWLDIKNVDEKDYKNIIDNSLTSDNSLSETMQKIIKLRVTQYIRKIEGKETEYGTISNINGAKGINSGCGIISFISYAEKLTNKIIPANEVKNMIEKYDKLVPKLPSLKDGIKKSLKCDENMKGPMSECLSALLDKVLPQIFLSQGMGISIDNFVSLANTLGIPNADPCITNDVNIVKQKLNEKLNTNGIAQGLVYGHHFNNLIKDKNGKIKLLETDGSTKPYSIDKYVADMADWDKDYIKDLLLESDFNKQVDLTKIFNMNTLSSEIITLMKNTLVKGNTYGCF